MHKNLKMKLLFGSAAVLMAATLVACSNDTKPVAMAGGLGTYRGEITPGATAEVNAYVTPTTDPTGSHIALIESMRLATGQPAYSYVGLTLDNTQGAAPVAVDEIQVTDSTGKQITYKKSYKAMSDLLNILPTDDSYTTVRNAAGNAENAMAKTKDATAGQKVVSVYVAQEAEVVPATMHVNVLNAVGTPSRVQLKHL